MNITNTMNPSAQSARRRHNPIAACAMCDAWTLVRKAQAIYGGTLRQYLAEALRLAWRDLNGNGVVLAYRSIIQDIRAQKAAGTFTLGRQSAYRAAYYAASW